MVKQGAARHSKAWRSSVLQHDGRTQSTPTGEGAMPPGPQQQQPDKLTRLSKRPNDAGQRRLTGPPTAQRRRSERRAARNTMAETRHEAWHGMSRHDGKDGIPRYPRNPQSSKDRQRPRDAGQSRDPKKGGTPLDAAWRSTAWRSTAWRSTACGLMRRRREEGWSPETLTGLSP